MNAKISLRIHAVWSGPSLAASRIKAYVDSSAYLYVHIGSFLELNII